MQFAFTREGYYIGPTDSVEQSTRLPPPQAPPGLHPRWTGIAWEVTRDAFVEWGWTQARIADSIAALWAAADAWNASGLDDNDRSALLWATAPPVWARLSTRTQTDLQRWYAWGASVWAEYWRCKARLTFDLPSEPAFPAPPDRARVTEVQAEIAGIAASLAGA